jgi:hypothetical protein
MQAYLAAHDDFVQWLDNSDGAPTAAEVDERLRALALAAAARGMGSTHWAFVVDGLLAYVTHRRPGDPLLASHIARGFDLCGQWQELQQRAA